MSSIGIWLWSNPSKFGFPVHCDPSFVVVGVTVRFLSPALRICSLLMYCLLLIPGVNLLPPFLFFLTLHILYNRSLRLHPRFWRQCRRIVHAIRGYPHTSRESPEMLAQFSHNTFQRQRMSPSDEESQVGNNHPSRSATQSAHPTTPRLGHPTDSTVQSTSPLDIHTAFLVVGLVCLAVINVIFLIDIELTLSRNRQIQARDEANWGFGQVLALLLLVIPLRDFVRSIKDIHEIRRKAQKEFEKHLRDAISEDTLAGHDFEYWINQGAKPDTELKGIFVAFGDTRHALINSLQVISNL